MDSNRFVQTGGDPATLSIQPHGVYRSYWVVLSDLRQVFSGDLYAVVHWRADAERLHYKR